MVNRDLWEELEELAGYHEVTWIHVRGHSGQPNHERCDSLAVRPRVRQSETLLGLDWGAEIKEVPRSPASLPAKRCVLGGVPSQTCLYRDPLGASTDRA